MGKKLTTTKKKKGGRSRGKISVRHRGGGHKSKHRHIDFKREKIGVPARIESIEYDPNRSARIALCVYEDGEKRYIIAPQDLKKQDRIICDKKTPIKPGNRMKLKNIPSGIQVYNIELTPQKGAQLVRSAGNTAQVMGQEGKYTQLKLPSGEVRLVLGECFATIGEISHPKHAANKLHKAGQARWRGKRPQVRGVAMTPADHPHGGGEGKTGVGRKHSKTPWGKPAYGKKTRKKKQSDKLIIKRRK